MIEKLLNNKVELFFLFIGISSIIISFLLYKEKIPDKGFYMKLYGYLISALIIGVTVFYAEKSSSKTSTEIKETGEKVLTTSLSTKTVVESANKGIESANKGIETANIGIDSITTENIKLKQQVSHLEELVIKKNNSIIDLSQQTADLSIRLAEKSKKIYDNITGGDSYFSTMIMQLDDNPNFLYFHGGIEGEIAQIPGKFPLSDVSIELYQFNKLIRQIPTRTYGIDIDYDLGLIQISSNNSFEYFQVRIFTPKRNYRQHFFLKRHTDGKLYTHIIQDDESYGINIRKNVFYRNYPQALKNTYPKPVDYAKDLMEEKPEFLKKHFSKKEID